MMVIIYSLMLSALISAWFRSTGYSLFFSVTCLMLATGWFLFHVYHLDHGFQMPWLLF